jgi:hypothetical protein
MKAWTIGPGGTDGNFLALKARNDGEVSVSTMFSAATFDFAPSVL